MVTRAACSALLRCARFARLPEGAVAGLQVCDLRDAGIQAALQLPPRAPPCDERTGELRLQDATPVHML